MLTFFTFIEAIIQVAALSTAFVATCAAAGLFAAAIAYTGDCLMEIIHAQRNFSTRRN